MARVAVKVSPKSSRDAIGGWLGETLKVAVTASPERGKANAAVEALLADRLGVAKSAVRVVAGHAQTRKLVEIAGLEPRVLAAKLGADG